MAIIVKGKTFKPVPAGICRAICVDVVDLGMLEKIWNGKSQGMVHKIRIMWETDRMMPEDENGIRPFIAMKQYTLSMGKKSNLKKDLESWRGKQFTAEEMKGFDVEKLIGAACQLVIVHNVSEDGTIFANISTVVKMEGGEKLAPTGKYKRVKDREGYEAPKAHEEEIEPESPHEDHSSDLADDDIPF